jgi:hypothetical protein
MVQQAAAHMVMFNPKSRPWYDYLLNYNYNPHAVFAGGEYNSSQPAERSAAVLGKCSSCSQQNSHISNAAADSRTRLNAASCSSTTLRYSKRLLKQ